MMVRSRKLLILLSGAVALLQAAPALACAPVTIYFDWGSAKITDESRAALERLALSLAWKGPDLDHILLTSHTDNTGSPAANRAIALRRAQAVRDLLAANDVPPERVQIGLTGEQRPRVRTAPGVREPRNRRVELLVQMSAAAQARHIEEGKPLC